MEPLILVAMGKIVPVLVLLKDGLGIKKPTKVDIPLNKENKPKLNRGFR